MTGVGPNIEDYKEAALRRLDLGASLAEVARACEVNPNLLHVGARKFANTR
jgi:transposase-like protein